jgi:uncharacterized protein (DUF885 family)
MTSTVKVGRVKPKAKSFGREHGHECSVYGDVYAHLGRLQSELVRGFHDAISGHGPLPLSMLETRVDAWASGIR